MLKINKPEKTKTCNEIGEILVCLQTTFSVNLFPVEQITTDIELDWKLRRFEEIDPDVIMNAKETEHGLN